MDPTVLIEEIRYALEAAAGAPTLAKANVHREVIADKFEQLDNWLSTGGFLPKQWDIEAVQADLDEATAWHQADLVALQHAQAV